MGLAGVMLGLLGASPLRLMLWRKRVAMWRHHAADTLSRWLFNEPMPRTAAGRWRLATWHDGSHWVAYVWRGDEWFGAGFATYRDYACRMAISEARQNVRRRQGRESVGNTW